MQVLDKPYSHICSQVSEFNYLFGVIDYNYPNDDEVNADKFNSFSDKFNKSQVILRFNLINEEVKELEQAIKEKNPIEIVDALCDILYVVAGAKVYFNLPVDEFVDNELCAIRDTSIENTTLNNENLKYITDNLDDEIIQKYINKITNNNEILKNLTELFINDNKMVYHYNFLKYLIRIYDVILDKIVTNIFRLEELFLINLLYQFDIVHASNMTKVCIIEEDAKETVEWYKKNELRYKNPTYRKVSFNNQEYYVIYDTDTNKILKSIKYTPAKFI